MDHSSVLFFLFVRKHRAPSYQMILFIPVSIENIHLEMLNIFPTAIKILINYFTFPLEVKWFLQLSLRYFPLNGR
jgi:hypothetical protein